MLVYSAYTVDQEYKQRKRLTGHLRQMPKRAERAGGSFCLISSLGPIASSGDKGVVWFNRNRCAARLYSSNQPASSYIDLARKRK